MGLFLYFSERKQRCHVLKMLLFIDHKCVKSNPEGLTEFRFLQRIRNGSSFPWVTFLSIVPLPGGQVAALRYANDNGS